MRSEFVALAPRSFWSPLGYQRSTVKAERLWGGPRATQIRRLNPCLPDGDASAVGRRAQCAVITSVLQKADALGLKALRDD